MDNGHPSLNSSKCLIVHVNLVNRYSPVFQSEKYESHLNEDVPVGSYVHAVMASDADGDGINGQILYSIVSGNDLGWFVINQDTGSFSLHSGLPINIVYLSSCKSLRLHRENEYFKYR